MITGIYKIEALCPVARMARVAIYIGQSKNIEARWKRHYKRFPPDQYSYEVLLACDDDYLDFFEKAFIDGYDSHRNGLNKTIGGTAIKARYPDAETKAKMSEAQKGKVHSEETKAKLSEARKGKTASEETKAKISAVQKGKPMSEEQKAKIAAAKKGKPRSEETKAKLSAVQRGKSISEEHKAKIAASNKGKSRSEETKAKMREAWKRRREIEAQ